MLEYVDADNPIAYWSAADLAEDSPADAHRFTAETRGVLFHSGDGDGAVLIGTTDELATRLEGIAARLRATAPAPVIDGEQVRGALPAARPALPAGD